jgi:membrane protein implicated in regulation of membrane protease activity
MTLLWLGVALAALVVELASVSFILLFVACAALVTAAFAQLGAGLALQIVVFAAASLLLPVLLRKRLLERISGRGVLSRTDALIGLEARVTDAVDPILSTGRVLVGGQDWAARSAVALPTGTPVRIIGADGINLLVAPLALPPQEPSDSPTMQET